jgi:hypothetical protein
MRRPSDSARWGMVFKSSHGSARPTRVDDFVLPKACGRHVFQQISRRTRFSERFEPATNASPGQQAGSAKTDGLRLRLGFGQRQLASSRNREFTNSRVSGLLTFIRGITKQSRDQTCSLHRDTLVPYYRRDRPTTDTGSDGTVRSHFRQAGRPGRARPVSVSAWRHGHHPQRDGFSAHAAGIRCP